METKKVAKADLESKRTTFFLFGLVTALVLILYAFEYKAPPAKAEILTGTQVSVVEDEIIPVTRENEVKPPPPPKPTVVEIFTLVEDDAVITEELKFDETDIREGEIIDVLPLPVQEEAEKEKEEIFVVVEDMPEFPGGEAALLQFIAKSIKYPSVAQENGIQGKVYVSFVINKDGSVSDANIVRSVDPSLDKEALRVINTLPNWRPGKQRGRPVKVAYNIPISFVLQ